MEFEPITPENIEQILDLVGYRDFKMWKDYEGITLGTKETAYTQTHFANPNWIKIIEAHYGVKLKPLPVFDFKQYLLDNGWKRELGIYLVSGALVVDLQKRNLCGEGRSIKLNKANADRLIAMAKIEAELESNDE